MRKDIVMKATYAPDSAMAALPNNRMRTFVECMIEIARVKPGHGLATEASRMAGYEGTTPQSQASMANNLLKRADVQAALQEMMRQKIREFGPKALAALGEIIDDRMHKDRLKAVFAVFDRIDPAVQHTQTDVNVNVKIDHDKEAIAQLRMLKALDVAREKLVEVFGEIGLERIERLAAITDQTKTVDAEFSEVNEVEDAMRDL